MSSHVVTVVDARVDPERESELMEGFRLLIAGDRPDGLVRSELLRGQEGAWRIQTTWRDIDALMALRSSGRPHAAQDLVNRLATEHSHGWFTVEQGYGGE